LIVAVGLVLSGMMGYRDCCNGQADTIFRLSMLTTYRHPMHCAAYVRNYCQTVQQDDVT
jgi:hypothetical protein